MIMNKNRNKPSLTIEKIKLYCFYIIYENI